jgi:hypothetical protein
MSISQPTAAEDKIKGLKPQQVLAAVGAATAEAKGYNLSGSKPVTTDMAEKISFAAEGLKALTKAGEAQGADGPSKAKAANPMAGAVKGQVVEGLITAGAAALGGPVAAGVVGGTLIAKQIGTMISGAKPPKREIELAREMPVPGYSNAPGASRKGSDHIGPVANSGTSFAAQSDGVRGGRVDILGNSVGKKADEPTAFDMAFTQIKVTPKMYETAMRDQQVIQQQAQNMLQLKARPMMDITQPNVLADSAMSNMAPETKKMARQTGGKVTLMDTGTIGQKQIEAVADVATAPGLKMEKKPTAPAPMMA